MSVNAIKSFVNRTLKDQFIQKWHRSVSDSDICSLYKTIKTTLSIEQYLLCMPLKSRKLLSKIRLSNHKLPVEKGRYSGIPHHERYCNICNPDRLGDEFHILFECTNRVVMEARSKFLPVSLTNRPSAQKCSQLLENPTGKTGINLVKFLDVVLRLFR